MQTHAQSGAKGDAEKGMTAVQFASGLQELDVKHKGLQGSHVATFSYILQVTLCQSKELIAEIRPAVSLKVFIQEAEKSEDYPSYPRSIATA
jgi:hypothetical protein